jgi:RNA polymerase sigma-70 factor (ECF subfamily)
MTPLSSDPNGDILAPLIERIAIHDTAALRELYELTSPRLFGQVIRMLGRREWAEEALQEAFINIWRFASDYRQSVSAPMAWMVAIVRHRALDYLRQRKAFAADAETSWIEMLDDTLRAELPEPSELLLLSQKAHQLGICMNRLEANQRRAVALAYLCGLTHREVAVVMDAPLGTVKAWLRRGTEKLRIDLEALDGPVSASVSKCACPPAILP